MSNADHLEEPGAQFRARVRAARARDDPRALRHPAREAARHTRNCWRASCASSANARFERCHLKTLGDSCLQFELSYFVQQPKINPLLDLQQAVNFRIIDEFRRLGMEFAYPAQRVVASGSQTVEASTHVAMFHMRPVRAGDSAEYRQRHPAVRQHRRDLHWSSRWASGSTTGACSVPASTTTTSRAEGSRQPRCLPAHPRRAPGSAVETGGRRCYADSVPRGGCLLFGPRREACPTGARAHRRGNSLFIPMQPEAAASICRTPSQVAYEAWRQLGFVWPRSSQPSRAHAHSVSVSTSRPMSACTAARTGRPSCMTRYTSRQMGISTPTRSATLRTAHAAVTPSTT